MQNACVVLSAHKVRAEALGDSKLDKALLLD